MYNTILLVIVVSCSGLCQGHRGWGGNHVYVLPVNVLPVKMLLHMQGI